MNSLIISIAGWGDRKNSQFGGIYRLAIDDFHAVRKIEFDREDGASRVMGGCAIDFEQGRIFAARELSANSSCIEVIDLDSFKILGTIHDALLSDVHQIEYTNSVLWIVNSNRNQVVLYDGLTLQRIAVWDPFPELLYEQCLSSIDHSVIFGDKRKRIHFNSICIDKEMFYVGHFGIDQGSFDSSQIVQVPWTCNSIGEYRFGSIRHLNLSGNCYPHNAIPWGNDYLVCDSGTGYIKIGDAKMFVGGWPRGVAWDDNHLYVGISSSLSDYSQKTHVHETNALNIKLFEPSICIIDHQQRTIVRQVELASIRGLPYSEKCQIYDVRTI
jgi:hypothetical protein